MDNHVSGRRVLWILACCAALLFARRVSAETLDEAIDRELKAIRESRAVETMREVWDIEQGCLTEDADHEKLETATELMKSLHPGDVKEDLAEMAAAAFRELNKPEKVYLGTWTATAYCNCSACCGQWAGGCTASGTWPTSGRTVAADLPFGTQLEIDGRVYTVEDRGVSGEWVDIYMDSHAEACAFGMRSVEVYLIKE